DQRDPAAVAIARTRERPGAQYGAGRLGAAQARAQSRERLEQIVESPAVAAPQAGNPDLVARHGRNVRLGAVRPVHLDERRPRFHAKVSADSKAARGSRAFRPAPAPNRAMYAICADQPGRRQRARGRLDRDLVAAFAPIPHRTIVDDLDPERAHALAQREGERGPPDAETGLARKPPLRDHVAREEAHAFEGPPAQIHTQLA